MRRPSTPLRQIACVQNQRDGEFSALGIAELLAARNQEEDIATNEVLLVAPNRHGMTLFAHFGFPLAQGRHYRVLEIGAKNRDVHVALANA